MISNETKREILEFRDERNWAQFHNPKDLAVSITLEAAELLENFQWSADDLEVVEKQKNMEAELADILIYCTLLSESLGVNLDKAIHNKLIENDKKYPIDKSFGRSEKYTELEDIE